MKRVVLFLSFAAMAACSDESMMAPQTESVARQATWHEGSGSISFSQNSGCSYRPFVGYQPDHYDCEYTVTGLDATRRYNIVAEAVWVYKYRCVNERTGRADKLGVRDGHKWTTNLSQVDGVTEKFLYETIDRPSYFENPCINNKGQYTTAFLVSGPTASGWRIKISDESNASVWARISDGELPM